MKSFALLFAGLAAAQDDASKGSTLYSMGGDDWNLWGYTDAEGTEIMWEECIDGDYQSPISLPTSKSNDNGSKLQGSYYNKISVNETFTNIGTGFSQTTNSMTGEWEIPYSGMVIDHATHYRRKPTYTSDTLRYVVPAEH
jgi:carbonic anhydrase